MGCGAESRPPRLPPSQFLYKAFLKITPRNSGEKVGGRARPGGLDLRVGAQAVEFVRGFVALARSPLTETRGDLVEGPTLGLRHLEVGEDEEEDEQHREDDEDVGAAELLGREEEGGVSAGTARDEQRTMACPRWASKTRFLFPPPQILPPRPFPGDIRPPQPPQSWFWGSGGDYRDVLEAHAHDEVGGPVGEPGHGEGGGTGPLAEEFRHDEPRDGARADLKEGHEAEDGHDAEVGHPGHLVLGRGRERKLVWGWGTKPLATLDEEI